MLVSLLKREKVSNSGNTLERGQVASRNTLLAVSKLHYRQISIGDSPLDDMHCHLGKYVKKKTVAAGVPEGDKWRLEMQRFRREGKKKVIWGAKICEICCAPLKKAATPPPAHPLRGTCWQLGTSRYLICVVCDNHPAGIFGGLCLKVHSRYSWSAYYGGKSTDNFRAGRRRQDSHAIKSNYLPLRDGRKVPKIDRKLQQVITLTFIS